MAALEKQIVEVERREAVGKGAARRLRRDGRIPASVYGMNVAPFSVTVQARRIDEVLHLGSGRNTIITLAMAGENQRRQVMIRDLQRHPVTDRVIHVDFVRVDPNREVTVNVPVQLIGLPLGVKNEGGILDFVHREIQVACLPSAIPEHLDVDVSELHINQHVSVADLKAPEGVKILGDPEMILAVVSATKAEVAAEAEEPVAAEGEPAAEGAEEGEKAEKKEGSSE